MYSWNTIRTVCAVLLLIPVIHLVYLVSRDTLAAMDTSPQTWAKEVSEFTAIDQSRSLPVDPIVVVGGRGVKLWRGLEDLLAPREVLMRGLGDATINDITHYHSQLISFYRPSAVVVLPGNSEFHLRDNKSAEELVAAIRELVELDQGLQAERQFYVFAPIMTPLYSSDYPKIEETTRLLERWAGSEPGVTFLDANPLLSLRSGAPNPDFYRGDGVNLNEHGYLRLSLILERQLKQDEALSNMQDAPL